MKKFVAAIVCASALGIVCAQEQEEKQADRLDEVNPAVAVVQAAPELPMVDAGTKAVIEAQSEQAAAEFTEDDGAATYLQKKVEEHNKKAKKGKKWLPRWDDANERYMVLESATFKCKDPANDKNFFANRDMAAKRALVKAKIKILEFIGANMSARDAMEAPGSDLNKKFGGELAVLQAQIRAEQAELVKMLEKVNKAEEAAELSGATFGQRLDDLFVATIKKLDAEYDGEKHEKAAKAKYEKVRAQYEAASEKYRELVKRAEALHKPLVSRQTSKVKVGVLEQNLYGATAIMQAESYNDGEYEVAVLVCWSKAMAMAADAIAAGVPVVEARGSSSVEDWIQKQDFSTMVGSRQFLDEDGKRWFLGVTARPYEKKMKESLKNKNKTLAELFAMQHTLFAVFNEVTSVQAAEGRRDLSGEEDDEEDIEQVAENATENFTNEIKERKIRGIQEIANFRLPHPITNGKIWVSVYGIDPIDVVRAKIAEDRNTATKIRDEKNQTVERSREAAKHQLIKDAANRPEDVKRGVEEVSAGVQKELETRPQPEPVKKGGERIIKNGVGKPAEKERKTTSGVFTGDADVNDDF